MMEDEELINKMREAVMTEKQIAWAGKSAEYQAVNDACLKSLANMVQQRFIEQACDAVEVRKNKLLEINESMPAKEQAMLVAGLCEAEQAIRDKFEGEK